MKYFQLVYETRGLRPSLPLKAKIAKELLAKVLDYGIKVSLKEIKFG